MECREVRDTFARGEVPGGTAADAHAAICEACRALLAEGAKVGRALGTGTPAAGGSDLDALFRAVSADVQRETGIGAWLRSLKTHHRVAVVIAVAVTTALAVLFISGQDPIAGGVAPVIARLLYGGVAVAAVSAGLRSLGRGPAPELRAPAILAAAVMAPLALAFIPTDAPMHHGGIAHAAKCLAAGLALGIPCFLVARLADRGGRARALGLVLLATGAGLVGTIALEMHCAVRAPEHLLLGHATVVVGYLAAAAVARAFARRPA
jgi:hypothetical protein